MSADDLVTFQARKQRLSDQLKAIASAMSSLDAKEGADRLTAACAQLDDNAFRVMIVGEFNRGKSTVINALLGREVVPISINPCTAVITELRYADAPHARLHYSASGHAPLDVPVDRLVEYVTIPEADDEDAIAEKMRAMGLDRVEVFYPLELCKNDVVVVDSPGLNDHATREKVTTGYMTQSDAFVMVLSCDQPLSKSETQFINEQLGRWGIADAFFLWNRFDLIEDDPKSVAAIRARSDKHLRARPDHVYFVAAKRALLGRKKDDPDLVATSRLQEFEARLREFLGRERGRAKLLKPLLDGQNTVREGLETVLPDRERLLAQELGVLERKYEELRPRIEDAKQQRNRMLSLIQRHRDQLLDKVLTSYRLLIANIESELPACIGKMQVGTWDAIAHSQKMRDQLAEHAHTFVDGRMNAWRDRELAGIVDNQLAMLRADLAEQATNFLGKIDALREAFSLRASTRGADGPAISTADRAIGAVGGLLLGGIGSAMEGAAGGTKAMTKGLALNMSVGIGLAVMGMGLPVILPALAAIGLWRTVTGGADAAQRMRVRAIEEISKQLSGNRGRVEELLRVRVVDMFAEPYASVESRTRALLDQVSEQVQGALFKKRAGEQEAVARGAELQAVRERLAIARGALDVLAAELEA